MPDTNTQEVVARSVLDRATAAADDAERRWPHNRSVLCDPLVEARLLDAAIGPDSTSAWGAQAPPDHVTLLWPANGAAVPASPDVDLAHLARQTFPLAPGQAATCDRCGQDESPYGALLFAFGAKVIGLVFCGWCAHVLDAAGFKPQWIYHPTTQRTQGD